MMMVMMMMIIIIIISQAVPPLGLRRPRVTTLAPVRSWMASRLAGPCSIV